MNYYQQDVSDVLAEVGSSKEGLTAAKAEEGLAKHGKNKLAEGKKTPLIVKFLQQLSDPMIIILMIAAVVSLAVTLWEKSSAGETTSVSDFADVIIIGAVVLLNAILGVVQESKAEQAIEALQNMTESQCKVLRDGKMMHVNSCDLTIGDVVLLEAGDAIPADCRIIECASLKVEEAALTGESVPVDKFEHAIDGEVALGDRKNMLYMGSSVAYGRARAVVVAVGMQTEMGKIANVLAEAKEEKTPLQIKMSQLSKVLTYMVLGICVVMFGINLIRDGLAFDTIMHSLMVAIGLAVAAIPEGLATTVTIVLSLGVTNMSKKNAVIRKLTAVETLGCAEIICSDKTGTLTQNKMTVVDVYGTDTQTLAQAMALCSDAQLTDGEAVGEPTECALVNYAYTLGLNKGETEKTLPRIAEAPFDSMRKMMSTLHQTEHGVVQYTKGAPDEIIARCTKALIGGEIVPMTEEIRSTALAANKDMANRALRVLAAAEVFYDVLPQNVEPDAIEKDMVFIGLCGMIDPVRPEVIGAIEKCRNAGIRPIMITGDHINTAVAIAMQLGIITDPSQAILGSKLDEMSDEEFEKQIVNYSVYARVQPEHKVRIVNTWKKLGKICAMTGDGVNDAPSIKSADIGVGMGITGTDVTKSTADMVLADDNFATIVTAVGEGRRIYDNIRKAIAFLLSSNLAEVVAVFVASLFLPKGYALLEASHLLWINLVTDCLPAIALGVEPAENDIMSRPPRPKNEGIFAGGMGFNVVFHGIILAVITLSAYFIGHTIGLPQGEELAYKQGSTMAFLALSMAEIFHAYNVRCQNRSIFTLKTHNKLLWLSMISSLVLTTAVLFIPGINSFFGFAHDGKAIIDFTEYVIALGLAISIIPIVEIQKLITRAIKKSKAKKAAKNAK